MHYAVYEVFIESGQHFPLPAQNQFLQEGDGSKKAWICTHAIDRYSDIHDFSNSCEQWFLHQCGDSLLVIIIIFIILLIWGRSQTHTAHVWASERLLRVWIELELNDSIHICPVGCRVSLHTSRPFFEEHNLVSFLPVLLLSPFPSFSRCSEAVKWLNVCSRCCLTRSVSLC